MYLVLCWCTRSLCRHIYVLFYGVLCFKLVYLVLRWCHLFSGRGWRLEEPSDSRTKWAPWLCYSAPARMSLPLPLYLVMHAEEIALLKQSKNEERTDGVCVICVRNCCVKCFKASTIQFFPCYAGVPEKKRKRGGKRRQWGVGERETERKRERNRAHNSHTQNASTTKRLYAHTSTYFVLFTQNWSAIKLFISKIPHY